MERVWIGIGSNLLDPKKQVDCAVQALSKLPATKLVIYSKYYRSRPLGYLDQPYFLNMVAALDTDLYPEKLLIYMQQIEHQQGRTRNASDYRWQPRTLDLDILLFGKYFMHNSQLIIPHYDMINREFVMYPLIELDYNLVLPNRILIKDIIKTIPKRGLSFWEI